MYVDLLTLYLLAIGTLLASAGMIFWEHRTNPRRSRSLRILATGFATLATGCAAVLIRRQLPGFSGAMISNLIMLCGYLLILSGVASFSGRHVRGRAVAILVVMALIWLIGGARWQDQIWAYVSAAPIALISGMTAWEMWRCESLRALHARRIVVAVTGIHSLFYIARTCVLPWVVNAYGPVAQSMASKITMYEGVLFSVILPMTLLKLVREELHSQLLRESQTDYLTRLGNRRWFFEQGARILDGEDGRGPVAVLAFDLDQFKAINDIHGHQTGDTVLRSFAEIARGVLEPGALLARIGGEEFAALLTGDDARRAQTLGQTIAQRFAAAIPNRLDSVGVPATVSIGLAQFEQDAPALTDGLAAADQALYRAKSLGGNRLELAGA